VKRRSLAALVGGGLAGVAGWDLWQRRHTILRNYPIIGHLRFILEGVGPGLRQYIVTDNDAEKPFSVCRAVAGTDHMATVFPGAGAIVVTAAQQTAVDEQAQRRFGSEQSPIPTARVSRRFRVRR